MTEAGARRRLLKMFNWNNIKAASFYIDLKVSRVPTLNANHLQSPRSIADPTPWPPAKGGRRKRRTSPPAGGSVTYLNNITWALRGEFIWVTCVNPLPAHGEGSSGLNEVIGDGAAVVSAGAPRQLGRAVCHFLHRHRVRRAGGAWLNHRNRHCEVFAETTLQNADVNAYAYIWINPPNFGWNYTATSPLYPESTTSKRNM